MVQYRLLLLYIVYAHVYWPVEMETLGIHIRGDIFVYLPHVVLQNRMRNFNYQQPVGGFNTVSAAVKVETLLARLEW